MERYYVYILYSANLDKFYTRFSENPWLRLEQHNANSADKYTGRAKDWVLKAVFQACDKATAISIERFLKRQPSRKLLERLCDESLSPDGILAQLVRVPHVRD